MRIHSQIDSRRDMNGAIHIRKCEPMALRIVAERIMEMVTELDYSVGSYRSVTEFTKIITVDYWEKYDGIRASAFDEFKLWYIKSATDPDLISRAIRWLRERGHYIFLDDDVEQRARDAEKHFSGAIKGRK